MAFTESEWYAHVPLTIDNTKVAATMPDGGESGFPVVLVIENGGDNWEGDAANIFAKVVDYTKDIAITLDDGATQLKHEIKEYNGTGGSELLVAHILPPSVAGATDTDVWLYYRDDGIADQQQTVYLAADKWQGYWALHEAAAGTGTAAVYKDLSDGGHDGNDYVSDAGKTGKVGLGQTFDGSDAVRIPESVLLDIAADESLTIMAWAYPTSTGANQTIYRADDFQVPPFSRAIYAIDTGTNLTPRCFVYEEGLADNAQVTSAVAIGQSVWTHLAGVFNRGGNLLIYVNNVQRGSVDASGIDGPINPDQDRGIGAWPRPLGAYQEYFTGSIDEVSQSNTARSVNWLTTSYNCQNDNDAFWTVGSEVPVAVGIGSAFGSSIIGSTAIGSGSIRRVA